MIVMRHYKMLYGIMASEDLMPLRTSRETDFRFDLISYSSSLPHYFLSLIKSNQIKSNIGFCGEVKIEVHGEKPLGAE